MGVMTWHRLFLLALGGQWRPLWVSSQRRPAPLLSSRHANLHQ